MKRTAMFLTLTVLLAGCGDQADSDQPEVKEEQEAVSQEQEMEPVEIQVLKADEENGVTLENGMYQQLSAFLESNPEVGVPDDFGVHPLTLANQTEGGQAMFFLGVNRLEQPIKNITFDYTLGVDTGNGIAYVLEKERVELLEPFAGTIQPGHVIPFTVPVTPEGAEVLGSITEENKVVKLENANFELEN